MDRNEEVTSKSEMQSKSLTEVLSLIFVTLVLAGISIKILFF